MDVQTITVVIAGISVIIGVMNSILSSRRAEKNDQQMLETRQAQLYTQIYNRWNSRDLVNAYGQIRYRYQWEPRAEDWYQKYGIDVNPQAYADFAILGTFFEGLGILVKKRLVDVTLVEDLLSQRIIWYWEQVLKPLVGGIRQITNDPTQWDHIEYLYNEVKQRQQAAVST